MRDYIETGESGSSKQCMITTAEGDDVEDQVFTLEVVRLTEDYFQHYGPCATGLDTGYYSFKGGFSGLDPSRIDAHFMDGVLIKQVETAANVKFPAHSP